jgi:hypothetical protein
MMGCVTGHEHLAPGIAPAAEGARNRKADQRRRRRKDGLRPLEIWLPAALIEKIDQLKGDDLSSREAVIAAIVATTLSVRSPEPSEGQPMML